jgi:hypothetical protein
MHIHHCGTAVWKADDRAAYHEVKQLKWTGCDEATSGFHAVSLVATTFCCARSPMRRGTARMRALWASTGERGVVMAGLEAKLSAGCGKSLEKEGWLSCLRTNTAACAQDAESGI